MWFRVRANDAAGNPGNWSSVRRFEVKNQRRLPRRELARLAPGRRLLLRQSSRPLTGAPHVRIPGSHRRFRPRGLEVVTSGPAQCHRHDPQPRRRDVGIAGVAEGVPQHPGDLLRRHLHAGRDPGAGPHERLRERVQVLHGASLRSRHEGGGGKRNGPGPARGSCAGGRETPGVERPVAPDRARPRACRKRGPAGLRGGRLFQGAGPRGDPRGRRLDSAELRPPPDRLPHRRRIQTPPLERSTQVTTGRTAVHTGRMAEARTSPRPRGSVGSLLQSWRRTRHLSQLVLAGEAGISARHLCFLETGRARPSREMVLLLAGVLDVPLRERNLLLLAAGFAPVYRESALDAPELETVRVALDAILRQQEPFPAVVMNRNWDVVAGTAAASRFFGFLLGGAPTAPTNVIRMMFDPRGLRPYVTNWQAVAESLVRRIHREAVGHVEDAETRRLLEEIFAYPDVPRAWRAPDLAAPIEPVVPVSFRKDDRTFNFFSTVTTLGTPQDITLQEIRIECFFPADPETVQQAKELVGQDGSEPARAGG